MSYNYNQNIQAHFKSSVNSIDAGTGITAGMLTRTIIRVVGNALPITVTATPSIPITGVPDGSIIILQGTDDTNTVTFNDEATTSGSKLQLNSGANCSLGKGDVLSLCFDLTDGFWYELFRSNN